MGGELTDSVSLNSLLCTDGDSVIIAASDIIFCYTDLRITDKHLVQRLEVHYLAAYCWGRYWCCKSYTKENGEDQRDLHGEIMKLSSWNKPVRINLVLLDCLEMF